MAQVERRIALMKQMSSEIWRDPNCFQFTSIQNTCLFNAKSVFMQIVLFQTIQFRMITQFNCQNISISINSVYSNSYI